MTWQQLAILELLTSDDTSRVYVESDGYGDDASVSLTGTVKIRHADLKEAVERGWIEVNSVGLVTVLNDGGVALVDACNALNRGGQESTSA